MFGKYFDDINLNDIQTLVDERIPEGRRLEYKRDHYGRKDEDKREFAADVSALANAMGGYILIGIKDENGLASEMTGVEAQNPDALNRAVIESIRTSIEPQILGVRIRWLEIEANRGILMIQVDRSWNAPHRVTVARDNRFFIRDENGKHPMSVAELRHAFLFASELEERIRSFRIERLELLALDEGPLSIGTPVPRLILHIVPQTTFTEGIQLEFDRHKVGIPPFGARGWNSIYSIDGLVTYTGPEDEIGTVGAFSTLFRNGIIEAVGKIYASEKNEPRTIHLGGIEYDLIDSVGYIISDLQRRSIVAPYYIMISLIGVRGLTASIDDFRRSIAYPYRTDKILLPELLVDEALSHAEPSTMLRPLFDLLWNAFGHYGSPNYDTNGNYKSR